jgi:integrating conjugative element protein (TIGR03749 family)
MPQGLGYDGGAAEPLQDAERVVYQRAAPVRVVMAVGVERLVTFPSAVAFRTPEGFDQMVQMQIIERTAYLRPLAAFQSLRVVAEDLTTGRQIPIDLVADARTSKALATRPMEVVVPSASRVVAGAEAGQEAQPARTRAPEVPALDMVGLTRYAAQSLYAPRRLIPTVPGVQQVPVTAAPVEGLYRGWKLETTPIAAWRSGSLYVTAVRFTNLDAQVHDIDLQDLRGQWMAATSQHTRLLAGGSDWDTTTVYLVCERPFEACR